MTVGCFKSCISRKRTLHHVMKSKDMKTLVIASVVVGEQFNYAIKCTWQLHEISNTETFGRTETLFLCCVKSA